MRLPGLGVAPYTSNDDFQAFADTFNNDLRAFVTQRLEKMLTEGTLPEDASGAGPTIVAAIAAMLHVAGYLTGSFEPSLDGDALAEIVKDQFNAGRADFDLYVRRAAQ